MSTSEARDFARATLDAFRLARDRAPTNIERTYSIADEPVLVRYAGTALAAAFDPALAPLLEESARAPGLTISCWDRATTGQVPPPPPWRDVDMLPRGRVRGFDDAGVRVTYDFAHGVLHLYDAESHEAVVVAHDVDRIPAWVTRAPFRAIFGWHAMERGLAVVHASAVGTPDGCVLITGASGSGKSTTAFACVERGLGIVADDVTLAALDPEPRAFACSAIGKLEDGSLVSAADLRLPVVDCRDEQTMVDMSAVLLPSSPVRAIVAAQVGGGTGCRVTPLSKAASFRALAGHSVVEARTGDPRALTALRDLATRVPAARVELGTDLDDVATTVRALLDRADAA